MKILRHETKIPLQRSQSVELNSYLHQLGIHPKKTYPDRTIHSIYLDDHEYTDYHDNVSGISRRSKTRLRWYNDDTSHLSLEIKRKTNKVSEKQVIQLENTQGRLPFSRHEYLRLMRENNTGLSRSQFATLFPVLEVRYERSYFSLTPEIRMTIDRKIQFRKLYPHPGRRWHRSQVDMVLEFKYPLGEERSFSRILRNLPFRIFRHSKYVIGVDNVCVG